MIKAQPSVAILLATYNGAPFLFQQLESIANQSYSNWYLYASDDGSTDVTLKLLEKWQDGFGNTRVQCRAGPSLGFVANFLSLICAEEIEADYYAFSDQDDIWDTDKLSRAVAELEKLPQGIPALYCSRTRSIDSQGRLIGLSPAFNRQPGFANALVHNIAAGNTMLLNAEACSLVRALGVVDVPAHDWWVYLLVSGAGGAVIFDSKPSLSYRQHDDNQIGDNSGFITRIKRYYLALLGRNRRWSDQHLNALQAALPLLEKNNRRLLEQFSDARNLPFFSRIAAMIRLGIYAQTFSGRCGLILAIILKRL
ncbi:glycosyltransferase family 2 protein [Parahaliea sp. F7430]|uniref:Glycosyltransferase family 2 protein n=1 Tax=Sediminihaliea albiluteola TaxID=2758564 RepID=A0A7W2TYF7_9GAMM|nr:glycosyltransferase family 2 protein [Sediminihaliea albiluteola]MBA6414278.1 glycosyltransferase family 2 protein [Sediminihaliea albiluteola]